MALTLPSAIPSSACVGSVASATWTSSLAIKTKGTKRIEAGKYWSQGGASWEFTLKNDSLVFNDFSIPGAGAGREKNQDPRLVAEKALGISKDNKTMTLSVPYPTLGGTFEMIFDYGPNLPKSSTSLPAPVLFQTVG